MSSGSRLPRPPGTEPFRCEVAREHDSASVRPVGELDVATVPLLKTELDALRSAGVRRLILDLTGLEFIDSSGLRCIVQYDAEARQDGFSIALLPGPPRIQRIFELTDTRSLLPFVDA